MSITVHKRLLQIAKREVIRIATKPMYLFCMVIAPIFSYIFFTTLMSSGLPTNMPAGVVDLDNTSTTRTIIRNLDAFQQTKIVAHYGSFNEAREAIQRGEIYSFYYIPEGTTEKAIAGRQPKVSFYTNYSYLIAGSLLYRDQRTMSELASAAIGQSTLLAKGATEDQAVAFLQPVVIDTHPLNNPWLNYSVYLCNTLFPGILMLLIFLITAYTIGVEIKENTAKELLHLADNSIVTALVGKLLPQTILFFIIAAVRHKGFLGGGGIRCVIILPCGAAQAAHNKERCPHGDEHRCKAQHQHQIHFFFYIHPGTGRLFCHDISFPFLAGLPGIYQGCNALVATPHNSRLTA